MSGPAGERVQCMPAHLQGLFVVHAGSTADRPAPEGESEVLDLVTVRVDFRLRDGDRGQQLRDYDDSGLLEALADGSIGWLLGRVDDATGQCPASGVRATPEKNMPFIVQDDGTGRGKPEQTMADQGA